ncbi:hypothetical protein FB451DRAFT_1396018 [Mycena latifolia]|nr:hypothetical protein FB451DRAFT_1396018 [Mycena latifolia]
MASRVPPLFAHNCHRPDATRWPHAQDNFVCPSTNVFATVPITWRGIGPARLFSPGGMYNALLYGFLFSALAPIPFYYLARRYPLSYWCCINIPVFCGGVGAIPAASAYNCAAALCARSARPRSFSPSTCTLNGEDAGMQALEQLFGVGVWGRFFPRRPVREDRASGSGGVGLGGGGESFFFFPSSFLRAPLAFDEEEGDGEEAEAVRMARDDPRTGAMRRCLRRWRSYRARMRRWAGGSSPLPSISVTWANIIGCGRSNRLSSCTNGRDSPVNVVMLDGRVAVVPRPSGVPSGNDAR